MKLQCKNIALFLLIGASSSTYGMKSLQFDHVKDVSNKKNTISLHVSIKTSKQDIINALAKKINVPTNQIKISRYRLVESVINLYYLQLLPFKLTSSKSEGYCYGTNEEFKPIQKMNEEIQDQY